MASTHPGPRASAGRPYGIAPVQDVCLRQPNYRSQCRALGRVRSEHLDPRQLAHASIEGCGEVATLSGMLCDDQAVCESAGACFEQAECSRDGLAILEENAVSSNRLLTAINWARLSCSKAAFSVQTASARTTSVTSNEPGMPPWVANSASMRLFCAGSSLSQRRSRTLVSMPIIGQPTCGPPGWVRACHAGAWPRPHPSARRSVARHEET